VNKLKDKKSVLEKELEKEKKETVCLDGLEEKERKLSAVMEQAEKIFKIRK
jgi:hypothetical protein